jgi:mannose-6-phosphate isomerase-like protein (cupin superfamily)
MSDTAEPAMFQVFRGEGAKKLMELGLMKVESMEPTQRAGLTELVKAGYLEGDEVQVLFNLPGFSLVRAWLKREYPLLLHSHDTDCLYFVLAGSLKMGTEQLAAGDGFFVPAGARYQYRPGPDGVEVLEFRHAVAFNFLNHSKGEAFYKKALETVKENAEIWRTAKRPSEISS